jgi:hypothetical protein
VSRSGHLDTRQITHAEQRIGGIPRTLTTADLGRLRVRCGRYVVPMVTGRTSVTGRQRPIGTTRRIDPVRVPDDRGSVAEGETGDGRGHRGEAADDPAAEP